MHFFLIYFRGTFAGPGTRKPPQRSEKQKEGVEYRLNPIIFKKKAVKKTHPSVLFEKRSS
jgi:hypothetical protein